MNIEHLGKIDGIMKEMVGSGFAAGASTMVLEHGKEVYYGAEGYMDIAGNRKVERDTIFRLYSMTKPITGAAFMLLVQDGLVDLDSPVGDYIPTFRNQTVVNGYESTPVKNPMRIKHLLDMSAGLTYGGILNRAEVMTSEVINEGIGRIGTDNEMSTMEFVERLGEVPLMFEPGTDFNYSLCADVLGAIIEKVTGKRFGEFLKERIFDPLDMKDTGFFVPADKQARLTKVYKQTDSGLEEFNYNHLFVNLAMDHEPGFQSGGAGLCSTLDDYANFGRMLLNKGVFNGKRVMEEGTVKYFTGGEARDDIKTALRRRWDYMDSFSYSNLMRVMKDPSKGITFGSLGEYGWDGWLGPYFINDPAHDVTILHMLQRVDSGTTSYMRRIRNVVYSCVTD